MFYRKKEKKKIDRSELLKDNNFLLQQFIILADFYNHVESDAPRDRINTLVLEVFHMICENERMKNDENN